MEKKIDIQKAKDSCSDYYDKVHLDYFNQYSDELIKKPYDQVFLKRFLSTVEANGKILDIGCCSSAQQARYFHDAKHKTDIAEINHHNLSTFCGECFICGE
jgi:hypothetical protein